MLFRVSRSNNAVTQALIARECNLTDSWVIEATEIIAPWCPGRMPDSKAEWTNRIAAMQAELEVTDNERLMRDTETHHNLRSYLAVHTGVNHSRRLRADTARGIHRLIVGGQGLRGGDPTDVTAATWENCCVYCLRQGRHIVETLRHVALECEAYRLCRLPISELLSKAPTEIFALNRDFWTWRELSGLTRFFEDRLLARRSEWGLHVGKARKRMQAEALQRWAIDVD